MIRRILFGIEVLSSQYIMVKVSLLVVNTEGVFHTGFVHVSGDITSDAA